jgi:hypothetical protein
LQLRYVKSENLGWLRNAAISVLSFLTRTWRRD